MCSSDLESGMNNGANPVHHVLEKVHEICDRVRVGLQLDILEESLQG